MTFVKKLKEKIFGRKEEQVLHHRDSKTDFYDHIVEKKDREWEEQFIYFSEFTVEEYGTPYIISTNFKEDETRKREITKFVKEGLDGGVDLMTIIINVNLAYGLGVAHKGIPAENKIMLFFEAPKRVS